MARKTSTKTMSAGYTTVAAFENSVRELISGLLLESIGDRWRNWIRCGGTVVCHLL